jgi:hypothetical protein
MEDGAADMKDYWTFSAPKRPYVGPPVFRSAREPSALPWPRRLRRWFLRERYRWLIDRLYAAMAGQQQRQEAIERIQREALEVLRRINGI